MAKSTSVGSLAKAIGQAAKSAKFCVAGTLPTVAPGLAVEGLGTIALPLKPSAAKALIAACQVAPFGKGTQTLVDRKVRNTFELDPSRFSLGESWNAAITALMPPIAEELGLPVDSLEPKLYKLLMYKTGGFFLPHRDSEKHDRMVASLIVVLPNPFNGGQLLVRHGVAKQRLTFDDAAKGKAPCYAAFYADCEHEVERVTYGHRLCLAYNLVLNARSVAPSRAKKPKSPANSLIRAIESWVEKHPSEPLVFALEHHYTQRSLSLDLLKGPDRELAAQVVIAAGDAGCLVHLAQVERHLSQEANDGSEYGYYRRRSSRHEIEIGETFEDELSGTAWTDLEGKKQPWGTIAFDQSAIISSTPLDQWTPTTEEYEGYTGNAGNTLDRWYHRSALVVWHLEYHWAVIAKSGGEVCIPLFGSMLARLAKTSKKRLEEAQRDCIRFARGIIAVWPRRVGYWHSDRRVASSYDQFPEQLLKLHERNTIALALDKVAGHDELVNLSHLIVQACREFGWGSFAREMKQLITSRPVVREKHEVLVRDFEWLCAFCCDVTEDPEKSTFAHDLLTLAVERFCEPRPTRSRFDRDRREPSVSETSMLFLLKALAASGHDDGLSRVTAFIQDLPHEFTLDHGQVPALKSLIPWTRQRLDQVPPVLLSWLRSIRQQLVSATVRPPEPPAGWARASEVSCRCQYCSQLSSFLADPASETRRIPAREDSRQHLISIIAQHQCDVKHALERRGSPFSLVLTKTRGSHERAVKRFETDQRLLRDLPRHD